MCFSVLVSHGMAGMNRMENLYFLETGASHVSAIGESALCHRNAAPQAGRGVRQRWAGGEPARTMGGWGHLPGLQMART